jgi:hypothetical protein
LKIIVYIVNDNFPSIILKIIVYISSSRWNPNL